MFHFVNRRNARKWLDEQQLNIDLDLFALVESNGRMFVVSRGVDNLDLKQLPVVRIGYRLSSE
ncbi:MAG: hypothetical protein Q7R96_05345 [Nanoarchaeota archaeon]|nr:hypothetical protein [Nanoarchaeota archaeon]